MHRRHLIGLALTLAAGARAAQPPYPERPVRWIVPYPAWGITDRIARAIAPPLGEALGQPVWVDNRSGGRGAVGSAEVAQAEPDGCKLLIATSNLFAIAPHLDPRLPYRTHGRDSDFSPIAPLAEVAQMLLVPKRLPVADLRALIAYAGARPGELNYASAGNGTISQLTAEAFKQQTGLFITHLPYRNTAMALPELGRGRVQVLFVPIAEGLAALRDGRAKALAVTGRRRSALAPELPTMAESGLPGFQALTWFGAFGPKALAMDIVTPLNRAFTDAVASGEVRERLAALGAEPAPAQSPTQFGLMIDADSRRWAELIRDRRIQGD